ncbi:CAZyme family GH72 and CBM43 [Penicillium roqueforti]|uniref:1,3-beta-glucanosyltransferase n=1 Tax=Penicillium roqueforti (strain FM164) TaxID=1365484 RepID=W6QK46_PENRF|nr:CAZyme family GH72 and CBM43 [Penicillium roqueforti]CDM29952.1 Glucanosyltransferase [Penicillium roqueforti FM164]KAF9240093.1 CAZyme family GH72 and CBM43 [Penicillium roqueforti]KAI1831960.1 CAZyme family GH72 and CBM43 [Penicillium roqueforti]KAI2670647.1 CAZyme family GH72 and CBM43 [Penicillium roqueforti]KAI2677560.1 CAZyme family GH72 and CBM43 [Penicillium roqueforti]
MKFSLVALATLAGVAVADLDPIIIKGSKFFYSSNDTQFFMRGVAYQQESTSSSGYTDPLADATACARDVPIMAELRTNVIRTYAINASADHSACMKLLSEAGIYVISDLSDPDLSIDRNDPSWTTNLFARYTSVVDELAQYNNTIGFFAGNEVSNTIATSDASAFVKAAVRDTKKYIKEKGYRSMGVGYATADVSDIRADMADYFDCGDAEDSIDFWGYNIYSWCGNSTYAKSKYQARTEEFANYSVPVFFAEYGCNEVTPREFTEVKALYGDTMAEVWSGGIVYMYFQEANNYGLVSVVDSTSVKTMSDFKYYSSQIANANPTGVNKASYTPTNTALQSCPTVGASWDAKSSPLPPAADSQLCECMYDASACVVAGSLASTKYANLFSTVCGYTDCSGLTANATTGEYGAYSMCSTKQQLAFALNKYYVEQDRAADACSFSGSATVKASTKATGTCSTQIKEAGTAGTGTVTTENTATADSSSASSTASSSTSSSGAIRVHHSSSFGSFQVAAYIATALLAGVGMIAL